VQFKIHLGAKKFNPILGYFAYPMLEYEPLKELFTVVKVKNNPLKHCSNTSGCGIIKAMHDVVIYKIKYIIAEDDFSSIDEKTTIDN